MNNEISFTKQIKAEICSVFEVSRERKLAILSAFLRMNGKLKIRNDGTLIQLKTDDSKIAKYFYKVFFDLFGVKPSFVYEQLKRFQKESKTYYLLHVKDKVDEILDELKITFLDSEINELFYSNNEYKFGYITGCFLATGCCNNPTSSNYHLEIGFNNSTFAVEMQSLINNLEEIPFNMRLIRRRSQLVLYLKKSDYISSFLVLIGAIDSCLEFENVRVNRDYANNDNRLSNLDVANYNKTLESARKQIKLIKKIDSIIGLNKIVDRKLKLLCEIRLENEDASMKDIATIMGEKLGAQVSKSSISRMFDKLELISQEPMENK